MNLNEAKQIMKDNGYIINEKKSSITAVDTTFIDHQYELLDWHRSQLKEVGEGILKGLGTKYNITDCGIGQDPYNGRWTLFVGFNGDDDYYEITVYEDGVKIVGETIVRCTKKDYVQKFEALLQKEGVKK